MENCHKSAVKPTRNQCSSDYEVKVKLSHVQAAGRQIKMERLNVAAVLHVQTHNVRLYVKTNMFCIGTHLTA